jgi:hypothetical protein
VPMNLSRHHLQPGQGQALAGPASVSVLHSKGAQSSEWPAEQEPSGALALPAEDPLAPPMEQDPAPWLCPA